MGFLKRLRSVEDALIRMIRVRITRKMRRDQYNILKGHEIRAGLRAIAP